MQTSPYQHDPAQRVGALDWDAITHDLDAQGCATIPGLLTPTECNALAARYGDDALYRSRVVMGQHGFGRGEYKYFRYPLPVPVQALRTALYPHLVPVANRWHAAMGIERRFPPEHATFLDECHRAGQRRPTPLLLAYGEGTTTACTRTCTAHRCFRSRWRSCCRRPAPASPGANS